MPLLQNSVCFTFAWDFFYVVICGTTRWFFALKRKNVRRNFEHVKSKKREFFFRLTKLNDLSRVTLCAFFFFYRNQLVTGFLICMHLGLFFRVCFLFILLTYRVNDRTSGAFASIRFHFFSCFYFYAESEKSIFVMILINDKDISHKYSYTRNENKLVNTMKNEKKKNIIQ